MTVDGGQHRINAVGELVEHRPVGDQGGDNSSMVAPRSSGRVMSPAARIAAGITSRTSSPDSSGVSSRPDARSAISSTA